MFQTRDARMAVRETLLVATSAIASFLFINHANLYLSGPFVLRDVRIESYILATIVIYLFIRVVILAVEMRPPRAHAELVRCPECGQWLDDPSAAALEAHRSTELTPKPTKKEVVSAVALRRAVDAARIGTLSSSRAPGEDETPSADPTNVSSHDLLAALDDPDLLERLRHSPNAPRELRFKR